MAKKAVSERRKRIVNHVAKMLIQWLNIHSFKDLTAEQMAKRIGLTVSVATVPWWTDIPEICEAAGLDIGLTIRDAKGNEVTLWPAENFSTGTKLSKAAGKKVERPDASHYTSPRVLPPQQQQSTVRYLSAGGNRVSRR